jgi:oligopeptide/dipeptide ABC transporter ATP-binding protein
MTVLSIDGLNVRYRGGAWAVRDVGLHIARGERVAVIGESGCGKSTLVRAIIRLLPPHTQVTGRIRLGFLPDMAELDRDAVAAIRGSAIGFVPQNPLSAFNPLRSVGAQLKEAWTSHGRAIADEDLCERLADIGIGDPRGSFGRRPSAWSGGMLQRALVLAATALAPGLVLADEPTSSVDAELSEQMMQLIVDRSASLLMVTHDLSLAARHVHRILVMYGGRIVEDGPSHTVIGLPRHPYTAALLAAEPRPGVLPRELPGDPPALTDTGVACPFLPRCGTASTACRANPPLKDGVACHHGPGGAS